MSEGPLFTPQDAAEYLSMSDQTLAQWRSQGRGPRYIRAGRYVRYRVGDLDRWLDEHATDAKFDKAPPRKRGQSKSR